MNTDKSMFEFYYHLEFVLNELKMFNAIELMNKHISNKRPSTDSMIKLTNKHGFVIKDLEQFQFDYRFASGSAMLNHYFIRLAFMDSWIKLLPKDKLILL